MRLDWLGEDKLAELRAMAQKEGITDLEDFVWDSERNKHDLLYHPTACQASEHHGRTAFQHPVFTMD